MENVINKIQNSQTTAGQTFSIDLLSYCKDLFAFHKNIVFQILSALKILSFEVQVLDCFIKFKISS